jgi:hypothetical protein
LPNNEELSSTLAGARLELAEAMRALGDCAKVFDWIHPKAARNELTPEVPANVLLRVGEHLAPGPCDATFVMIELDGFREELSVSLKLPCGITGVEGGEDFCVEC